MILFLINYPSTPTFTRGTNTAVVNPRYNVKTNISTNVVVTGPEITDDFQPFFVPSNGNHEPMKLPNTTEM